MSVIVLRRIKNRVGWIVTEFQNKRNATGKIKFFCVGRNKTGTTSLKRAFEDLFFRWATSEKPKSSLENITLKENSSPSLTTAKQHRFSTTFRSSTRKPINTWIKPTLGANSS